MRAGLSTIQPTLTPDAATILTLSISEAARRNHGQTTPLHVAATLLSSPNGLLRQACIKSHPNSSHPLQCRALELCFSVALDRLPASSNENNTAQEPPISNALMAALKRAQAHQRRGCPEQQQSPLLAVKVELDQLIVSILDDPSVSRVMKEASFSSPNVKAAIEHTLSANSSVSASKNTYMNPLLLQQPSKKLDNGGGDEAKKILEIFARAKKRNPILVGDSDLKVVINQVMERIEKKELGSNVRIVSLHKEFGGVDKSQIQDKVRELRVVIDNCKVDGVVLDLGDLKWLVEYHGGGSSAKQVTDIGKEVVAEMAKVIVSGKVWAVGTATCTTYLRCQVYFPTMEVDWDLQAVHIAPRAPNPGLFPRLGSSNGILSGSIGALAPMNNVFPVIKPAPIQLKWPPEKATSDDSQKQTLCSQCTEKYEQELAKLVAKEFEKSSSESRPEPRSNLPQWLQMATPNAVKPSQNQFQNKEHEVNWKQDTEVLLRKWRLNCSRLHSNSIATINPMLLQQKKNMPQGFPQLQTSPPNSPVRTELALGRPKPPNIPSLENARREIIKEFSGCNQGNLAVERASKITSFEDSDSIKRLYKGLTEKVSWQTEAASAVTAAVLQSKSGMGRRRGLITKTDTWLLFIGSDRIGKRKMASALSELVFGNEPIMISLDNNNRTQGGIRGRTALDRVVDSVKRNPFSVVVLEDIDRADILVRGTIKQAIERGRLPDSYGREVNLGSTIFVLTANWLPDQTDCSNDSIQAEEKLLNSASSSWQLEISIGEKKRLPDWLSKDENPVKRKKESDKLRLGLSLDLNLATGGNAHDENGEGSWNSSDLTTENEQEHGRLAIKHSVSSASEFVDCVDNAVVFKPVDFVPLRRKVTETISEKLNGQSIRFDENVLDKIVGGVWLSGVKIEEWAEKVLTPTIEKLKNNSNIDNGALFRLSAIQSSSGQLPGNWLPSEVRLAGM